MSQVWAAKQLLSRNGFGSRWNTRRISTRNQVGQSFVYGNLLRYGAYLAAPAYNALENDGHRRIHRFGDDQVLLRLNLFGLQFIHLAAELEIHSLHSTMGPVHRHRFTATVLRQQILSLVC